MWDQILYTGIAIAVVWIVNYFFTSQYRVSDRNVRMNENTNIREYIFAKKPLRFVLKALTVGENVLKRSLVPIKDRKLLDLIVATKENELFGCQQPTLELFTAILNDPGMTENTTPFGRLAINTQLEQNLVARGHFMKYFEQNHEKLSSIQLKSPIVITGLFRTGSTLLQNLLACDPNARAPYFYEMIAGSYTPIDPPKGKEVDTDHPWFVQAKKDFDRNWNITPDYLGEVSSCHAVGLDKIDEEWFIALHTLPTLFFLPLLQDESNQKQLMQVSNIDNVYTYIYKYLQMLQSTSMMDSVSSPPHWVLKAPIHSAHLITLSNTFQGARLVITHRRLGSVVGSFCLLMFRVIHPYLKDNKFKKSDIGRIALKYLSYLANECVKQREQLKLAKVNIIDVFYDSWIDNPINLVRELYNEWELSVSEEFESEMKLYLQRNPKGKYGSVSYSLEEFGLTKEVVVNAFQDYIAFYDGKIQV